MDTDGRNIQQITSNNPVSGFRQEELDYTWSSNADALFYPSFNKVYKIKPDGSGNSLIYTTPNGRFVSEIGQAEFNPQQLVLKTNDANGYDVKIFTINIATGQQELLILEGENGAAGGIDISANGNRILYYRDLSGSENSQFRIFEARLFIYDTQTMTSTEIMTDVASGQNDLDPSFSPNEGAVIFTRVSNSANATPNIYSRIFEFNADDKLLFTGALMPDWSVEF